MLPVCPAWAVHTCTRCISRQEGAEDSAKGGAWAPTRDGNQVINQAELAEKRFVGCLKLFGVPKLLLILLSLRLGSDESAGD